MNAPHLTAELVTTWLGRLVWLEAALFETVGQWTYTTAEPSMKEFFATSSHHHWWRAELLRPRLHHFGGLDASERIAPGGDEGTSLVSELGQLADGDSRLAVIASVVLPRLAVNYRSIRLMCQPVSDAPTMRLLDIAINDVMEDWLGAETIRQRLDPANLSSSESNTAETGSDVSRIVGTFECNAAKVFSEWSIGKVPG